MLTGKKFFVTGATGRLGCETVLRLEELGATVVPLVLPGYPFDPRRVDWKAGSKPIRVYNVKDVDALVDPHYVINFHWKVNRALSFSDQLYFEIGNNIQYLSFLWEWLADKDIARFINISSIRVFSRLNTNPISSETEPRPITPYGIAKLTAERFFDAFFAETGWPVVHLRLCSVASFGEHPSHLMSRLYSSAFENVEFILNTGHTCTVIYIDEIVDLIINAALSADSSRYIITTEPVTTDLLSAAFENHSGKKINALCKDLQPGIPDQVFVSDRKRLQSPWTRSSSLESMINNYIDTSKNGFAKLTACTKPVKKNLLEGYHARNT